MTACARQDGERGTALLLAVLLTAAVSVAAGVVVLFAVLEAHVAAAARSRAEAAAAVEAALAIGIATLAAEPDLAGVRAGRVVSPSNGVSRLEAAGGAVDVEGLSRDLAARRARLPTAAAGTWQPYAWGRLGELAAAPVGVRRDDPLVVVWVRADDAAALGDDHLELAVEARTPRGARAALTALVRRTPAGLALMAVRRDGPV